MVPMMLRETHYGHAWSIGFVALALALVAGAAGRKAGFAVAALGVAAFAYSRSAVSHAAGAGDFTLRVAIDWVHLLLACLWVGMVLVGAFSALRAPARTPSDAFDAAAWVAALSSTATGALAVIFLTGALKVWWATPSVAGLRASDYGAVLLVKLSLVAVAVALGGFNRLRVMPALLDELRAAGSPSSAFRRRFVQVLRIEALVLLLVLVAAAVLSGTESPAEAQPAHQLENS
jgi:putative copper resistance protein D